MTRRFARRVAGNVPLLLLLIASCQPTADAETDDPLRWRVVDRRPLQDPEQSMTPAPWGIVADPRRNRIFVVDGPNYRVLMFGGDGSFFGEFGEFGSGPGEFRDPWAISLRPDGNLSVLDPQVGQVSRWTRDGHWISSAPIPPNYWGPEIADLGDRLVAVTTQPVSDPMVTKQDLTQFRDGVGIVLGSVTTEQVMVMLPCLQSPMPVPKPVARQPIWTVKADTVLAVLGVEYSIDFFVGGERKKQIVRNIPPTQVTEEKAVERIAQGELRIFINRCGVDAQTVAKSMDWEETVSPLERVVVAPDGLIWASRTGGTLQNAKVDIFESDGRYIGTLEGIPQPVSFLSPNQYVGFGDDAFGMNIELIQISRE